MSVDVLDFCVDMVGVVGSSPIAPTKFLLKETSFQIPKNLMQIFKNPHNSKPPEQAVFCYVPPLHVRRVRQVALRAAARRSRLGDLPIFLPRLSHCSFIAAALALASHIPCAPVPVLFSMRPRTCGKQSGYSRWMKVTSASRTRQRRSNARPDERAETSTRI